MTTTNNHRAARRNSRNERSRPDPALVHGDQACMQLDQDYRQLEQGYHHSAQYAAMELPQFGGQVSGLHGGECTGSDELLFVVDWAEVANR